MVFELTCPWDSNIESSHTYKEEKYAPLIADLSRVYKTFHFSFEVSARGQITKSNRARIKELVFRCCADPKSITKLLSTNISKAALLSSFSLFCARNEPSWVSPNPLIVRWQFFPLFFYLDIHGFTFIGLPSFILVYLLIGVYVSMTLYWTFRVIMMHLSSNNRLRSYFRAIADIYFMNICHYYLIEDILKRDILETDVRNKCF